MIEPRNDAAPGTSSAFSPRPPVLRAPDLSRLRDGGLADVDLRGLEMRSVSGVGSLGGATVSGQQLTELAQLMAAHLGLRVEDEDRATTSAGEEK